MNGDHIYPQLHGTGGIGPGSWQRQELADAQERAATRKFALASQILVKTVLMLEGSKHTMGEITMVIARML